ncbi:MAG: hypothetical protein WCL34_13355 [Methylococcaceae bacterium]
MNLSYKTIRRLVGGGILCGAVLMVVWGMVGNSQAETSTLYPKACLGGWQHPDGAAGTPDVLGSPAGDFNKDNSAWTSGSLSQIFCGSFHGDIPVNTSPTKIVVRLAWAVRGTPVSDHGSDTTGSDVNATTTITGDNFASSTEVLLDTSSNAPSMLLIPIQSVFEQISSSTNYLLPALPAGGPDAPGTSVPQITPASDVTSPPEPALETVPPSAPQSYLSLPSLLTWFFIPEKAFAATTADMAPDQVQSVDDVLEVLYTLDGTTWQSLGTVSAEHLNDATFEIPLEAVHNWDDLSGMQISVRSLSGLADATTLYLDGMQLEVAYGPLQKDVVAAQVELKEDARIAYISSLPQRNLNITIGDSTSSGLILSRGKNSDDKEELVIHAAPGSAVVYNDNDSSFGLVSAVGDEPTHLPVYSFPPGQYTLISTTEPGACQSLTKTECLQGSYFIASAVFSVTDAEKTN